MLPSKFYRKSYFNTLLKASFFFSCAQANLIPKFKTKFTTLKVPAYYNTKQLQFSLKSAFAGYRKQEFGYGFLLVQRMPQYLTLINLVNKIQVFCIKKGFVLFFLVHLNKKFKSFKSLYLNLKKSEPLLIASYKINLSCIVNQVLIFKRLSLQA